MKYPYSCVVWYYSNGLSHILIYIKALKAYCTLNGAITQTLSEIPLIMKASGVITKTIFKIVFKQPLRVEDWTYKMWDFFLVLI